jgi:hypothetical protein
VDDGGHPILVEADSQPTNLASAYSQQLASRLSIEYPRLQAGQNLNCALLFCVQSNCPHTSSMRTLSLSS